MQLPATILAGLAASALAAPASLASNTSLVVSDLGEQSMFCSEHSMATVNAMGQLCAGGTDSGPLIIGSDARTKTSTDEFSQSPHPVTVRIEGNCISDPQPQRGLDNGPPEDVSDICMGIFWQMCAASVDAGSGVMISRGKNKCQRWLITGWVDGHYDWTNLKDVSDLVHDP